MPTDTALGKILEIDSNVVTKINDVSTAINGIAVAAQETSEKFVTAFNSMIDPATSLREVLERVAEQAKDIDAIKIEVDTTAVEQTSEKIEEMSISITEAAKSLSEFNAESKNIEGERPELEEFRRQIEHLESNLRELQKVERGYIEGQESAPKGSHRYEEFQSRIDATGDSITSLVERLTVLRDEYTKLEAKPETDRLYAWLEARDKEEKLREATVRRESKQLELQLKEIEKRAKAEQEADQRKERALKRRIALEQERTRLERASSDPRWAIENAATAKSYDDRAKAIKYLEAAMKGLDSTDKDYKANLQSLSSAHKKLVDEQREVEKAMGKTRREMSSLMAISYKLKTVLATTFSISAITGYVKKLIAVRGEFELQNVALASILQNKEKADELFGQITELAIKSPFTVRQLTTYTKQLAAYQVEYDKLYDVTKKLADVSAGLGVDMGRLILAFGQVKAANYLRATEVRQFTEAGINILGELSKYYTELEGRMVSVADVQERITKRMVEFGAVEEVFNRITSSSGIFYQMQERQAETLKGMMSNLQDRMDIMLNEIGQKNQDAIKNVIRTLTSAMDNYNSIIGVIKRVIIAFGLYKTNILAVTAAQVRWANGTDRLKLAWTRLMTSIKSLPAIVSKASVAMKGFLAANASLLVIAATFELIAKGIRMAQERTEKIGELTKKNESVLASLYAIKDAYDKINATIGVAIDKQDDYNKKFVQLTKLNELLQDAGFKTLFKREEGVVIPITLEEITEDNIDEVFRQSTESLERAREYGMTLGEAIVDGSTQTATQLFPKGIEDAAKEFSDAFAKLSTAGLGIRLREITNNLVAGAEGASDEYKRWLGYIQEGKKDSETEAEWRKRELLYLERMSHLEDVSKNTRKEIRGLLRGVWQDANQAEVEMYQQAQSVIHQLAEGAGGMENLLEDIARDPISVKTAIDKTVAEQQWDELAKMYYTRTLYTFLKINIVEDEQGNEATLTGLAGKIKSLQDESGVKLFESSEISKLKNFSGYVDNLQKKYKDLLSTRSKIQGLKSDVVDVKNTNVLNQELDETNKLIKEVERQARIFNITLTDKTAAKTANQIAKERIDLLQKIRKEYEQNRKVMGEEEAGAFTKAQFADSEIYKQLQSMGVIDATLNVDANGLIAALERLADQSTVAAKKEIEAVIASLRNEQVIIDVKANFENVKTEVDKLFDRVKLTEEIEKLGLGKELTEQLFDFKTLDLAGLREQLNIIEDEYAKSNHGIGEEQAKYFAEVRKKIADEEQKQLQERLKTYAKYLKKEASVAVQAKLEEARQLAEIEATTQFTEPQKEVIRTRIREETQAKVDKATWDEFKNTDMYIRMFEDLEYVSTSALDAMESKLVSLRDSLKNLDPQNLKEIERQMQKIEEIKMERSPLQSMIDSFKEINALRKQGLSPEVLQAQIEQSDATAANAQKEISSLETIIGLREQGNVLEETLAAIDSGNLQYLYMSTDELREQLNVQQDIKDKAEESSKNANKNLGTYDKAKKSIVAYGSAMSKLGSEISGLLSDVNGLIEDITGESSGLVEMFGSLTGTIGESAEAVVMLTALFIGMGIALDSALGIIGYIIIALKAIIAIVTAIIRLGEKNFEKQMDEQQSRVERLQKAYEKLSDAIDKAYDSDKLKALNRESEKTLKLEIQQEKAMLAMYRARKNGEKKYKDEIEDLQKAIEDAEKEIYEMEQQAIEDFGGIREDSIRSTAEEFVSAWKEAFDETGAGITGLSDKFDELLDNLMLKQASLKIGNILSDKIVKMIDEYVSETSAGGEDLTSAEMAAIRAARDKALNEIDAKLTALYKSWGYTPGLEGAGLSGLAEDYGQMTEATATVLASINESIRFFESDSNLVLHNIENMLTAPAENPFYLLMQQQAQFTKEIRDMISGVYSRGSLNNALKVQIV